MMITIVVLANTSNMSLNYHFFFVCGGHLRPILLGNSLVAHWLGLCTLGSH